MAIWIDYGMLGFCINSKIKSKYQCCHHIVERLTDLSSNKQRSDNLMAMRIDYGMFWFCLKYGYNLRVIRKQFELFKRGVGRFVCNCAT